MLYLTCYVITFQSFMSARAHTLTCLPYSHMLYIPYEKTERLVKLVMMLVGLGSYKQFITKEFSRIRKTPWQTSSSSLVALDHHFPSCRHPLISPALCSKRVDRVAGVVTLLTLSGGTIVLCQQQLDLEISHKRKGLWGGSQMDSTPTQR